MTKAITPQELFNQKKMDGFSLIDVREPSEYQEEHIEGATLVPLAKFLADPSVAKTHSPVIFICRSGRRSEVATQKFLSIYPDATAYNLTGGLLAWRAAQLPLVENDLDSQDP